MRRRGLILPSLLLALVTTLLLGALCLSRPAPDDPADPIDKIDPSDPSHREALQRWRTAQQHHWRACLLRQ